MIFHTHNQTSHNIRANLSHDLGRRMDAKQMSNLSWYAAGKMFCLVGKLTCQVAKTRDHTIYNGFTNTDTRSNNLRLIFVNSISNTIKEFDNCFSAFVSKLYHTA